MVVDKKILDELTSKGKENPRLRCNLDVRNSADDQSQRMLNALEPGTVMPIHRHKGAFETCACIEGILRIISMMSTATLQIPLNWYRVVLL